MQNTVEMEETKNSNFTKIPETLSNTPNTDDSMEKDTRNIQYGSIPSKNKDALQNSKFTMQQKLIFVFKMLTIEPLMFAYVFSQSVNMSCLTSLMIDKGCQNYFNFSQEICRNLSAYETEKKQVEILANNYSLYYKLVSLLAAVMMIFIAPWSDKYGRKIPLIVCCCGALASDLGFIACTLQLESKIEYLILAEIPLEFCGGFICVLMIVFSHASEVSSEKHRTLKYTLVEMAIGLGLCFGMLTGGMVYKHYGYFYVYLIGGGMHVFCILWAIFALQETTGLDVCVSWQEKMRDFFTYDNFTKGWKAATRARPNKQRIILLLCFASMCVVIMTYESLGSIAFIYVHHIFNWDPSIYSEVNTVYSAIQMIVMLISVPLLIRQFKVTDYMIGIVGSLSIMAKYATFAFARGYEGVYYLGLAFGYWSAFASLAIRSGVSKIADKEELGKLFAFLAVLEAVFPIITTAIVTKIFNATLDSYPSIGYFSIVGMMLLPLGSFIFAYIVTSRQQSRINYEHVIEEKS